MTDRENKLRALLDRVRASRSQERTPSAAQAVERFKTEAGGRSAPKVPAGAQSPTPPAPVDSAISVPQTARAAVERGQVPPPPSPAPFNRRPSLSPTHLESPTRYSSQPPSVERPLSSPPASRSEPPRPSTGPVPVRAQSVAPGSAPVVQTTQAAEVPTAKTFGELLELTLSLRPQ